ncbi:helix-turn-helix transcriptional regulator [Streptomyces sp. PanSC9]|uniref:helix-turn-helix domain-containing protein n=1 Tax=Streptomyces sp. PanSC9 TaxID=1520461 RepID=UPI000FAFCD3A|nr:helix-turn-helix transcriptional regulator [Streptomyces sp. PanSC9]ROP44183.1 helix-turn-helix protein [Streptomyces sp. PanSC9]
MDSTTRVEGLMAALASVKAELAEMGHSPDVINLRQVSYETGIAEPTIAKLFAGMPVPDDEVDLSFRDRLRFLVATRRGPEGCEYRPSEIAAAIGVSKATVNALLNGTRNPGFDVSRALAEYFAVDPGFFSIRGDRALLRAIEPAMRQARLLASLRGEHVEMMALRGSLAGGSPQLAQELQDVLETVVATARQANASVPVGSSNGEQDPELQELTDTVRALSATKRRSVMNILRSVVGLAAKDSSNDSHP